MTSTTAASAAGAAAAVVPNPALVHTPSSTPHARPRGRPVRQRTVVKRKAPPALKAFAGSIGGLAEALFLQPVVRVNFRPNSDKFWVVIRQTYRHTPAHPSCD